jgi:serine/threonine protein phosphatase PrpC
MLDAVRSHGAASFSAAGGSDQGRVRAGNEDRFHVDMERGIFVVVDGVGGHAAGEVAAGIAVEVITQRLERPLWSPEQRVREAIALANNEILNQAQDSPTRAGMTCVLTLALLSDQRLTIGHVGDTRLYTLSAAGMVKRTHDHSPIGEREDAREITEVEAMRHPRRNEVFRDVGSAFHEPDDPDFIEIVEARFDRRSALLICSDGLSDMLSSTAIERTVHQHAGNPAAVVDALILGANEAGGKDNITVVYVEGDGFAASLATAPRAAAAPAAAGAPAAIPSTSPLWRSRATWLALGLLAGLALGIGLAWTLAVYAPLSTPASRRLTAGVEPGRESPTSFTSIAAALAVAEPRDVVQIEPGEYAEAVDLKDGIDLVARIPGTVTLVAPPGQTGWTSLSAGGHLGNQVSGIRILGRPGAPIATALRLSGHDLHIDDVTVEGTVGVGLEIVNDGTVVVRASRLTDIEGLPLRIGDGARPVIRQNIFAHARGVQSPAMEIAARAEPEVRGNVFVGYTDILSGGGTRQGALLEGNYMVRQQPRAAAGPRRQR